MDTDTWRCGRALVRKPEVFLVDEPLCNLDAKLRVHMRREIARLHKQPRFASLFHREFPFQSQATFEIGFEGVTVGCARVDLIIGNQIVVELKSVDRLREVHYAKLKSSLRATSLHVGLLFHFNAPTLTIRRMVPD